MPPLTRGAVLEAHKLIETHIHRTPVITSKVLNKMASTPRESTSINDSSPARPVIRLHFKCENMQRMGAFKARGAFHAIERLLQEPGWVENGGKEKGVVGFSSGKPPFPLKYRQLIQDLTPRHPGNHAQALALAATDKGIKSYIVMPSTTRPNKIAATKGYGAEVIFSGPQFEDREVVAAKVVNDTGARLVPPHDHPDIILGQATAGLEFQQQVKDLDAILSPCSGGGLLSGTALSCEGTDIRVFGAEPEFEGADDGRRGYYSGTRIAKVSTRTIADGLIGTISSHPWSIIYERRLVSGMYAVSEEEIVEATKLMLERLKIWVEPSAAVPLAVVLFNEDFRSMVEREAGDQGWDIGIIVSGGNINAEGMAKLFSSS
ncbi:hypothetical protein MRS44_016116 [Fusarium solani]|uniref:uncharacterized protein n=1 Tax=Fusarium solani TaxID=169388 RepID=UPI0032C3EF91|nr:hypothetical protein MRS44_016116 [Fusarium solani]